MSRRVWAWARLVGGALILGFLVWRLGSGPFVDGVRMIDGWALVASAGIAVVVTLACAWRWSLVARGLGIGVPLGAAVAAYYRSQFLNTTLPGGVLGDVHRAVRHGDQVGDLSRGLRAVAWERTVGQVVQVALAAAVLVVVPSPMHAAMPAVAAVLVALAAAAVVLARIPGPRGRSLWARIVRTLAADIREGLLPRRLWPGVVAASAVAAAGHTATFLVAARTAGATASPVRILPLALVVLVAAALPTSIAGWGPREGAAAWAFSAAGLGADEGVATAAVYGVLVMVASLPGAAVMMMAWVRRDRHEPDDARSQRAPSDHLKGAARG